jgi:hypothetical protein
MSGITGAGGLYQIKNYNTNLKNNYLEVNPQISFFKTVYRKYSRFAIENKEINEFNRSKLSYDNATTISCDIPRNGDLIKNLYFTFEIPNIYSGNYTNNGLTENFEFQWIKNIGTNIFNYVTLKINNQEINKLYGDYINIWKELTLTDSEKEIYNRNIGHLKEYYDPKNGPGMNGNYPNITTSSSNTDQSSKWQNHVSKIVATTDTTNFSYSNAIPSIIGRKIRVPLPFWFSTNSGLALPLISMQYSILSLELEMKPFKDLYTIIDANGANEQTSFGKRIKPGDFTEQKIENFTNNYDLTINPKLEAEYIFLDEEERTRFALYDHEYLITQPFLTEKNGVELLQGSQETIARLIPALNPVKYITWVIKRDDMTKINEWNNYSNWAIEDIPPYSHQYSYERMYYNMSDSKVVFYNTKDTNDSYKSKFSYEFLKKHVLTDARIELDGVNRIDKVAEYFERQQINEYFKTNCKEGIYVYTFSINPNEYQPSGCINMANISRARLYLKKNSSTLTEYNYRAYIYIVTYNILLIKNGIASVKFAN